MSLSGDAKHSGRLVISRPESRRTRHRIHLDFEMHHRLSDGGKLQEEFASCTRLAKWVSVQM